MEEIIIKTLKSLRAIEPSNDFIHRSKSVILNTPKTNHHLSTLKMGFWESLKFGAALSLASILIFVIVGGASYVKNLAPTVLTGLEDNNLLSEASAVDFQIKLSEIKYYEEAAKEVTALLNEVSKNEN
jgi:hypothetical protein